MEVNNTIKVDKKTLKDILKSQNRILAKLEQLRKEVSRKIQSAYYKGLLQAYSMEFILEKRDDYKYWRFIDVLKEYKLSSAEVRRAFKAVKENLDRAFFEDKDISKSEYRDLQKKATALKKEVLIRLGYNK